MSVAHLQGLKYIDVLKQMTEKQMYVSFAGAYAPSIVMSRQIQIYEAQISAMAITNWQELNNSNYNTLGRYSAQLAEAVAQATSNIQALQGEGHVSPYMVMDYLFSSYSALRNNSVLATGYNVSGAVQSNRSVVVPVLAP